MDAGAALNFAVHAGARKGDLRRSWERRELVPRRRDENYSHALSARRRAEEARRNCS